MSASVSAVADERQLSQLGPTIRRSDVGQIRSLPRHAHANKHEEKLGRCRSIVADLPQDHCAGIAS